jgi:hypothetical protein
LRTLLIVGALSGCVFASGCGSDSDGYTPKERATQLHARLLGVPESKLKCFFESDAGHDRVWYVCQPRGYYIACDNRTTDEPLTGPMENRSDWGDCISD